MGLGSLGPLLIGTMPPLPNSPLTGTGFFLNSADTRDLARTAGNMFNAQMGLLQTAKSSWAGLWIESPDKRRPSLEDLKTGHSRLKARGIRTVLWTFPSEDDVEGSAKWIGECFDALVNSQTGEGPMVLLDIEVDFKSKGKEARKFVQALRELKKTRPGLIFGFTSYPFGHGTLPWSVFMDILDPGISPVMPQLYTSGADPKSIARAWTHYSNKFPGCPIVPVVASYIEDSRRLKASLDLIVPVHKPKALSVWVLRTTDMQEAQVLSEVKW